MRRAWHLLALLSFGLTACPGELEDPDRFLSTQPSLCALGLTVETDLFPQKCGTLGCHGVQAPSANLDLVSPNVASRLIGTPGTGCEGRALVVAAAPDQSALLDRIKGSPECGLRMPLGQDPLSAAEYDCVRRWIFKVVTSSTSSTALTGGH